MRKLFAADASSEGGLCCWEIRNCFLAEPRIVLAFVYVVEHMVDNSGLILGQVNLALLSFLYVVNQHRTLYEAEPQ